jgi:hypothetical protein
MAILTNAGINFGSGDDLNSRRQIFQLGAAWTFYQSTTPVGWTKVTTHDNKALRVVSGTGGGSAGTNAFTTTMSSFVVGGPLTSSNSLSGHPVSVPEITSHTHGNGGFIGLAEVPAFLNPDGAFTGWNGGDVSRNGGGWTRTSPNSGGDTSSPDGVRGAAHSHGFSGSGTVPNQPLSIAVQYIDIIICTFNG